MNESFLGSFLQTEEEHLSHHIHTSIQIFELLFLNWSNRNRSFMLLKDITMGKDNSSRKKDRWEGYCKEQNSGLAWHHNNSSECNTGMEQNRIEHNTFRF